MLVTLGRGLSPQRRAGFTHYAASDFSNLYRWFQASDESSVTATGNNVTSWADKSGNGGHATGVNNPQTGTRTSPTGTNQIDFNGTSHHFTLSATLLTAYTKVVSFEVDVLTAGNNTISNITGNDALWMDSQRSMSAYAGGSRIITVNTELSTGTTITVAETCDANGAHYLWVNGVFQGMGETPFLVSDIPYIGRYGGGNYLNGAINEIAVYNRVLNISEINNLGRSLAQDYGGTWLSAQDESVTDLRVVALGQRTLTARQTNGSTNTVHAYRWAQIIAQDASDLVVSVNNWYGNNSNVEEMNGNDIVITDMALENEAGTIVVPVYFGGSRSITLINGASNIQSDAILPSSFSLSQFSKSEKYFLKGKITVSSSAHYIPYSQKYYADNSSEDQAVTFDPASTTCSDTDTAGKYTQTGTAFTTKNSGYTPVILGTPLDSTAPVYIIVGDSIADYHNDTSGAGIGGRAFAMRAMHDAASLNNPIPALNVARYGSTSSLAINGGKWKAFIKYTNRAIEEYGTNDVGTGTPPALATLQSNISSIWSALTRNGVEKIIRTKLLMRTTSTDSWQTEANQTYATNWDSSGRVSEFNAWLDDKLTDETIDALTEGTSVRGTDSYKWVVTGASNYATSDGLHPNSTTHELLAVELRSAIAALEA